VNYRLWFKEGLEDFERAKRLVELSDVKAAYFFLHQTIEKVFKALLLKKSIFVRTHDISILYDYVSRAYDVFGSLTSEEVEVLKSLTIHYSAARYPDARMRFKVPEELYSDVGMALRIVRVVTKVIELSERALEDDLRFGFDERGLSVDEIISKYVDRIKGLLDLACVIVFGSRARGDWKIWSDVDVAIIVRRVNVKDFDELFKLLHEPLIEYRIYTVDEALQAVRDGDPTILLALFEGVVVYDDGIYSRLRELFERLWRIEVLLPGVAYRFERVQTSSLL